MISACGRVPFTFAELRKAKSVESIGIMIDSFIPMSAIGRYGDECTCGNSHTIGKCERAQRKTSHGDCGEAHLRQHSLLGMLRKEDNKLRPRPSMRWASRKKLSILCILSIPAFVQPSSLITASTSWRSGSICSGWARRRYNTCVSVYRHAS